MTGLTATLIFAGFSPSAHALFSFNFRQGQQIVLTASAEGTKPFKYQWQKNGVDIQGATGATYSIPAAESAHAGDYTVKISNVAGATKSEPTRLLLSSLIGGVTSGTSSLLSKAPAITTQPAAKTVTTGTTTSLSVAVTGYPAPTYQWRRNGVNLANGGKYSGATTAKLTITGATSAEAGTYSVVVKNASGTVTSANATLKVNPPPQAPAITKQPSGKTVTTGTTTTLSVTATGYPAPTYQWRRNGVNLANGGKYSGATTAKLTIASPTSAEAGTYSVVVKNASGTVTSANAALKVNPPPQAPAITTQPAAKTVTTGATTSLSVAATGYPAPTYQWRRNGVNLANGGKYSGATTAKLTITGATSAEAGTYSVVVKNASGTVTSANAALKVNPAPQAPTITTQPTAKSVTTGTTTTFTVTATGYPAPSYQWRRNGVNLANGGKFSGVTTAKLTITSATSAEAGTYSVVVKNASGTVTSANAALTIKTSSLLMPAAAASEPTATIPSGFDVAGYLARHPENRAIHGNEPLAAWQYYRDFGVYAGEVYDDRFRAKEYLALYPELAIELEGDVREALLHWLEKGMYEGRSGRFTSSLLR